MRLNMKNKNLDEDYLSISEFAKFVGITIASLRNYDLQGVFSAEKRGEAEKNKYRYYSPVQITTVKIKWIL